MTMSAREREIIEKFHQLQPAAKQRVWALLEQEVSLTTKQTEVAFDYAAWTRDIEGLRQQIRATHEDTLPPIDVIAMLRDIRDGEEE
jgi:hypothetical protein